MTRLRLASLVVAGVVAVAVMRGVNVAHANIPGGRVVSERGWSVELGPEWVAQRDGTFVGSYGKPNHGLSFYSLLDLPRVQTLAQLKDTQIKQWKAANLKVTGSQETKIGGRPVSVLTLSSTEERSRVDAYGREYDKGVRTNRMIVLLFLTSQGPGGWALEASAQDADMKGYLQAILATFKLG